MRFWPSLITSAIVASFFFSTLACFAEDTDTDKLSAEGFNLLATGDLKGAEQKLLEARNGIEAGRPKYNDIEFALSEIHEKSGDTLKAITEFEWALMFYEGLVGLTNPTVADKLDHLSIMLRKVGYNNRAEITELEAKLVREKKVPYSAPGDVAMAKDGTISLIFGPDIYEYKRGQKYYQAILNHVKPLYPETDKWLLPGNLPQDWPELRNADAGPLHFEAVEAKTKTRQSSKQ
jgi:hypothetical protein